MAIDKRFILLLVLFFYFMCYILPLGNIELFVPDEPRYAEIPREMIAGGDWTVPRLNGLRYFEKPVFGYWAHAVSLLLLGESNFAVRLPSAVSAGLSALLLFVMVRRTGDEKDKENGCMGVLASLIFLSCMEVFVLGNIAILDNLFSLFLTAAIGAFFFASEEQAGTGREKYFLILSGVACGLAFLSKGFLAFAIPVITVAPYLIWERRYRDLVRMSWIPFVIAVLVILPWGILIHLKEPEFWKFFFWNEHIRRFLESNAQHKKPFWYFLKVSPGVFMPWSFLVPAAIAGFTPLLKNKSPRGRLIRFSICWFVLPFLFFSYSSGKLITYILPCFPPFAILMFFGLKDILKNEGSKTFNWGVSVIAVFFALIISGLIYAQLVGIDGAPLYGHSWKAILLAVSMITGIMLCVWALKISGIYSKIMLIGLSPLLFFFIAHFTVPGISIESKLPGVLLEKYKNTGDDMIVIADENTAAASCWYLRRNNIYVLGDGGELSYGLAYPDASHRSLDIKSVAGFINENRGKTVLVGRVRNIERWKEQLPDPQFRDESGPNGYALLKY